MADVVVIGGGIVGAAAAYRLARCGVPVTLVDRADPGQATAAGAGIIAPATSLRPLPPFYPLAARAVGFYPELLAQLAEDGETNTGYEVVGSLFVAASEQEAARLDEVQRLIEERRDAGMPNVGEVRRLDGREARDLFPALADLPGAIYVAGSARLDGRLLRDALLRAAERRGARVRRGDARPVRTGDRVTGVAVDGERIAADVLIVAAGAWSSALGDALGLRIPVAPQRGQILHLTVPTSETGRWPIVVGFHSHYLLTFPPHRVVAGATREDGSGYDVRMTAGGVHEALSEALRIAPGLAPATLHEVRIGLRPASPDQLPLLGPAPGLANVFLATGHGPSGLQLGPYSGVVVADLARGAQPDVDLAPFAPIRFA
ncbi:MAG: FAD-dependent oxidoreductase [Sphaerobacter sp.]|nr:FAD-dependent oxidoreductase [Sphaerobacter sp.]